MRNCRGGSRVRSTARSGDSIGWEGILEARTTGPWPLAHFAFRVLRQHAPEYVTRTVLCHGDVGPGNFMHDDTSVTALLDWEFSHLGDPMDDLAWWLFRGHDMTGACGDLDAQLERWESRTGLAAEPSSIEYYRAFVILRWLVCAASALDQGGPSMDRSVYFGLVPILSVRLPRSLAAVLDLELPAVAAVEDRSPGPNADVIEARRSDLADVILPAAPTPEIRRRSAASLQYVSHLAADDRVGPAVRRSELDDVESLTGTRPADTAAAERAVARCVSATSTNTEDLLAHFWRSGHRHAALWPMSEPRAVAAPTSIPSPVTDRT